MLRQVGYEDADEDEAIDEEDRKVSKYPPMRSEGRQI